MAYLTQERKNQRLLEAAKAGDADAMEAALLNGAEIGARNEHGYTALILAAAYGQSKVCQMLLDKGVDLHAKDNEHGYTALIFAAAYGQSKVCQMLLDKGVDLHAKDNEDDTALIFAAAYGHSEICQALIAKGADINAKSNDGTTALMSASENGHNKVCQVLIEKNADIDATNNEGKTALIWAVRYGHSDTGKWLLRYGAGHDGSYRRINYWRAQMSEAARAAFPGNGAEILATACFTDGRVSEAILDACATGQFGRLVAAPLIKSTKPADRQLFKEVWDKLPRYWQDQYETLYVEFIKAGGMKPFIGKYTADQHSGSDARMGRS